MRQEEPSDYLAILIRLWREEREGEWRVQIEDAHSGEVQSFPDLEAFIAYLRQRALPGTGNRGEPQ